MDDRRSGKYESNWSPVISSTSGRFTVYGMSTGNCIVVPTLVAGTFSCVSVLVNGGAAGFNVFCMPGMLFKGGLVVGGGGVVPAVLLLSPWIGC